jgi:hypothetical protein
MRGAKDNQRPWLEQRVQLSRGHWRSEDRTGAVRSAGWWQSATVTWSPVPPPERRAPLLHRALAAAFDAMAPAAAEAMAAGARRLLERRPAARRGLASALPLARRALLAAARELPRSRRSR